MLKLVSGVTISSFTDPKLGIPATTIKQLQAVYEYLHFIWFIVLWKFT